MNPLLRQQAGTCAPLDVPHAHCARVFSAGTISGPLPTSAATVESTVRTLTCCDLKRSGPLLTWVIEGDGFLYKMCRGIVAHRPGRPRKIHRTRPHSHAGPQRPTDGGHDAPPTASSCGRSSIARDDDYGEVHHAPQPQPKKRQTNERQTNWRRIRPQRHAALLPARLSLLQFVCLQSSASLRLRLRRAGPLRRA